MSIHKTSHAPWLLILKHRVYFSNILLIPDTILYIDAHYQELFILKKFAEELSTKRNGVLKNYYILNDLNTPFFQSYTSALHVDLTGRSIRGLVRVLDVNKSLRTCTLEVVGFEFGKALSQFRMLFQDIHENVQMLVYARFNEKIKGNF